jgi:molybdopterin-guanine dinucleotide biosynthesis protein A
MDVSQKGVVGVLLAGGRARRMGGGDKCLRPLGDRPILAHVIARARPQVEALVLNANGDPARFAAFALPVAADLIEDFAGPLAGVLTGMAWARANRPDCPWIATIATDTPFFPGDLVARLRAAAQGEAAELACAASAGRAHPVFGLWPVRLADDLRRAMVDDGICAMRTIPSSAIWSPTTAHLVSSNRSSYSSRNASMRRTSSVDGGWQPRRSPRNARPGS